MKFGVKLRFASRHPSKFISAEKASYNLYEHQRLNVILECKSGFLSRIVLVHHISILNVPFFLIYLYPTEEKSRQFPC